MNERGQWLKENVSISYIRSQCGRYLVSKQLIHRWQQSAVILTVIKHVMAANDLRVELADHTSEEDHGNSRYQENADEPAGHAPEFDIIISIGVSGTAKLYNEHDQDDHELTAEKVSV